jgi:hypothetical protein
MKIEFIDGSGIAIIEIFGWRGGLGVFWSKAVAVYMGFFKISPLAFCERSTKGSTMRLALAAYQDPEPRSHQWQ